jgi:hypothetical protein
VLSLLEGAAFVLYLMCKRDGQPATLPCATYAIERQECTQTPGFFQCGAQRMVYSLRREIFLQKKWEYSLVLIGSQRGKAVLYWVYVEPGFYSSASGSGA